MELIKEVDFAKMIKKSAVTLRRYRKEGKVPNYKRIGKSIRYDIEDVKKWIERRNVRTYN